MQCGVGTVTPDTVHFIAQMIRHQRGIATCAEKWINSPTFSKDEAITAMAYFRKILDAYERSLVSVAVD